MGVDNRCKPERKILSMNEFRNMNKKCNDVVKVNTEDETTDYYLLISLKINLVGLTIGSFLK